MSDLTARLEPLGLRPAESSVIMLIEANPGITQSTLGRQLDIQRANMTPLTARLESQGYIERMQINGRSHGLKLSQKGKDLHRQVRAAVERCEMAFLDRIALDQREAFTTILKSLFV